MDLHKRYEEVNSQISTQEFDTHGGERKIFRHITCPLKMIVSSRRKGGYPITTFLLKILEDSASQPYIFSISSRSPP